MTGRLRWDIFCRIVDNYGDIGVCWRLARQLAHEYGLQVRLWVDDLGVAKRLIENLDPTQAKQTVNDIEICNWQADFTDTHVADVVIEAFACELPEPYLMAMAEAKPNWLNLEYLSAEPWITGSHLLASPHPRLPLTKHFFFPGFDPKSGGVIREQKLIEKRDRFLNSKTSQTAFWEKLGVGSISNSPSLKASLFCYPHAPLGAMLEGVAGGTQPTVFFVPYSSAALAIGEQLGIGQLVVGDIVSKGNLTLQVLPFLSQDDYDKLLWACDINFVRGEDSWARALWAGKPLIWQPYRQEDDAHLIKLQAFLNFYAAELDASYPAENSSQVLQQLHLDWSNGIFTDTSWQVLLAHMEKLRDHAQQQSAQLAAQPDLAAKLVIFCENFSK